jgi:hypothetical protein
MSGPTANARPPVIWAAVCCHRLMQIPMQKNKCIGREINAQDAPRRQSEDSAPVQPMTYQHKQRGKTQGGVTAYRWNLEQLLAFVRKQRPYADC